MIVAVSGDPFATPLGFAFVAGVTESQLSALAGLTLATHPNSEPGAVLLFVIVTVPTVPEADSVDVTEPGVMIILASGSQRIMKFASDWAGVSVREFTPRLGGLGSVH